MMIVTKVEGVSGRFQLHPADMTDAANLVDVSRVLAEQGKNLRQQPGRDGWVVTLPTNTPGGPHTEVEAVLGHLSEVGEVAATDQRLLDLLNQLADATTIVARHGLFVAYADGSFSGPEDYLASAGNVTVLADIEAVTHARFEQLVHDGVDTARAVLICLHEDSMAKHDSTGIDIAVEQNDDLDVDPQAVQDDDGLDINLDDLELEGYLDRAARVEVWAMEKEAEREAAQERHYQAAQIATELGCTHREGLIIHDARQQHEHAEMDLISARRLFEAAKQAWNRYYETTSNHTAAQDAAKADNLIERISSRKLLMLLCEERVNQRQRDLTLMERQMVAGLAMRDAYQSLGHIYVNSAGSSGEAALYMGNLLEALMPLVALTPPLPNFDNRTTTYEEPKPMDGAAQVETTITAKRASSQRPNQPAEDEEYDIPF